MVMRASRNSWRCAETTVIMQSDIKMIFTFFVRFIIFSALRDGINHRTPLSIAKDRLSSKLSIHLLWRIHELYNVYNKLYILIIYYTYLCANIVINIDVQFELQMKNPVSTQENLYLLTHQLRSWYLWEVRWGSFARLIWARSTYPTPRTPSLGRKATATWRYPATGG